MYKEYIDIKFGDKWASEFNLVVVSSGDRYSPPVFGNINSNISTVAGKRGVYKWKTQIGEKIFPVNIAFDNLSTTDLSKIKQWLNPTKLQKLVFSDEPHKFYYACLNGEPQFEFLPFLEKDKVINNQRITPGVYKGELNLEFCAIDNCAYCDYNSFGRVEIEPDLTYETSKYVNTTMPWVQDSNLINSNDYAGALRVQPGAFDDIEIIDEQGVATDSGLSYNKRFYLLNSGNTKANLNLSFDLILPEENKPLIISIQKVKRVQIEESETINEQSEQPTMPPKSKWQPVEIVSQIMIDSFKDYIPFIEFLGQDSYDQLINGTIEQKKAIQGNYIIEIDSELKEIYIKEKANLNHVLNINKFNASRSFLELCDCNFVDYTKPFPTLTIEIKNADNTTTILEGDSAREYISFVDTSLENTYFNEIFIKKIGTSSEDEGYRLVNLHFNWKHTYI